MNEGEWCNKPAPMNNDVCDEHLGLYCWDSLIGIEVWHEVRQKYVKGQYICKKPKNKYKENLKEYKLNKDS